MVFAPQAPTNQSFAYHHLVGSHIDQGVDTTTLAAHDFDVDTRSGFMPPEPPLARLGAQWEPWEAALDLACKQGIRLGDRPDLTHEQKQGSEQWRQLIRDLPLLSIEELKQSELELRRAHQVLAWILHFYIHSLPPTADIIIPRSIALPLLRVSAVLQLPPVLTYSDTVLYNWAPQTPSSTPIPQFDNLRCNTLFTSTVDEQEFYLSTARIEFAGVRALELVRETMDEIFVGDEIALRRVTTYLEQLSVITNQITQLLLDVQKGCDPQKFFNEIRPWFRGVDSTDTLRPWIFQGVEEDTSLDVPTELSGPSAGQSSLVHALDIFLGVDIHSHDDSLTGSSDTAKPAFLDRMRKYMPRYHRNFLTHLSNNPRPLRTFVEKSANAELIAAYNAAVKALKEFRDAHIRIVTLYIIIPANKASREGISARKVDTAAVDRSSGPLKGTGGTELSKFLKGVRDCTTRSLISDP